MSDCLSTLYLRLASRLSYSSLIHQFYDLTTTRLRWWGKSLTDPYPSSIDGNQFRDIPIEPYFGNICAGAICFVDFRVAG